LTGATKVDRIGTSVAKARKTVEAVFAMKKTKSEREVIAYLRVSNLVQAERGQSMEAQEASIREYAMSEGLIQNFNQLRVFYDRGKSAFRTKTDKRVGWGHMMNFAQKGDVIISTKLDRCFRSVSDAAMTIEMLRSKGIDLHFVDRGCVTGDSISDGLTFNILASVAAFESKLKSSRIKEVKSYMADNFMYSGGKRERGFMQQVIGGRKYLVANDLDKLLLLKVAALKKKRDKEMQETGYSRCMNDSAYSLKNVRQVIIDYAVKLGDDKQYQVEKFGEGGYMHGEDLYAWVDRAEKLFSISTLHYLVGDDENRNVYARLAKIKEVERKIKKVDGEFVLAKDKAKTTRGTVDEEGDRINQQLSLLSAGLKSKQKVDKAISSRIVKKKAAARA
jgi:DNA invertase Pin-like site-specific DNA recombinase